MSTRTRFSPFPVIVNGNMASNITSAVTVLQSITKISYQFSWSGTSPVGTIALQLSNDYSLLPNGSVNNAGTWTTATISVNGSPASSVAISGNTGNGVIDVSPTATYAARVVYTAASGSGTLNCTIMGKIS